jgi:TRAP-type C4-dicarboxylate transport system permease small subunit
MFTVALVFVQIIMRYLFSNALSWSEELARYIFIWQLWLGVSYATKNHSHIRIKIIENVLNERQRKILEAIALVVWFGFGVFVIYQGWKIALLILASKQRSPALGLPMFYAYVSVPIGATLMNLRIAECLYKLFKGPEREEMMAR